jgi:acyl-CoA synthetase (AMP-forming)/AMP-acid ligase II
MRAQFPVPQFAIFAQGTHAHHFLEFDLRAGVSPVEAVASLRRLRAPQVAAGGINLVVAFGSPLWSAVAPAMTPPSLTPFTAVTGTGGRVAPAAQHAAWLWISGSDPDVTWDHARAAAAAVDDVARLAAEQAAFTYREGRDLTGFVDGTANPPIRRAADVALVPIGQPGAGGSHVIAMRWVHDLRAFDALSVPEQERVIGRSRPEESAQALRGGWLHTGDVGRFDQDGYLMLVDRVKDLIIRGGENIYPKEIEDVLYAHPSVLEAAVVGQPDAVFGEQPVAFVVFRPGRVAAADDLIEHCRATLARYKVPREVYIEEVLPKNAVGKIAKPVLRERLRSQPSSVPSRNCYRQRYRPGGSPSP